MSQRLQDHGDQAGVRSVLSPWWDEGGILRLVRPCLIYPTVENCDYMKNEVMSRLGEVRFIKVGVFVVILDCSYRWRRVVYFEIVIELMIVVILWWLKWQADC